MMARTSGAFIGIRVPEPIKQEWAEMARRDGRSLSNWIIYKMVRSDRVHSEEQRPIHERRRRSSSTN